ncbi:MAG: carbon-nitrogen hydrolase family protein [Candidatus Cloacimonetes bacterium]|nr:carbon-nitrogen hydrolase family protein [Candidatus Cloacimonadota bacterium]
MKISACVFPVLEKIDQAIASMHRYIEEANAQKSDLIIFPEAALGGLNITGIYTQDSQNCLAMDSSEVKSLQQKAIQYSIGIGFGFLEKEKGCIYDSFVLFDKFGQIAVHYHRISRGWLPSEVTSNDYACGNIPGIADTIYGKIGVLICGDLFEPEILNCLIQAEPDFYLHIMARSFPCRDDFQKNWDEEEFPFYLNEYQKLGKPIMVCNCVEENAIEEERYCGGAWFIKGNRIINRMPLLQTGLLNVELLSE